MEDFETFAPIVAYGLFGLLEVFAGYRLFRILVVLLGVLAGLTFGPQVYQALIGGETTATLASLASLLAAFVAAVVFGVLLFYAYGAGVFLWAGLLGYTVAGAYLDGPIIPFIIGAGFGLVVALLERPLIIMLTSLHGAWLTLAATSTLLRPGDALAPLPAPGEFPALSDQPLLLVAGLFLALAGIIVQRATPSRTTGIGERSQRR